MFALGVMFFSLPVLFFGFILIVGRLIGWRFFKRTSTFTQGNYVEFGSWAKKNLPSSQAIIDVHTDETKINVYAQHPTYNVHNVAGMPDGRHGPGPHF